MRFGAFTICHPEALWWFYQNCIRLRSQFKEWVLVYGETSLHFSATEGNRYIKIRENSDMLDELEKNYGVTIVNPEQGMFFQDKTEMCNAGLRVLRDKVDYVIQIDSDEWYTKDDMSALLCEIEDKQPIIAGIHEAKMWSFFLRLTGGIWDGYPARVFQVNKTAEFTGHRPPRLKLDGLEYTYDPRNTNHLGCDRNPYMYHFCYTDPILVLQKSLFFSELRKDHPAYSKYYQWFVTRFIPWQALMSVSSDGVITYRAKDEFHPAEPYRAMKCVVSIPREFEVILPFVIERWVDLFSHLHIEGRL